MDIAYSEAQVAVFDPRAFDQIVDVECRRAMRSDIPMSVALIQFAPELTAAQRARVAAEISAHLRRGGDALCAIDDLRLGAILIDSTTEQARLFLDAIRRHADHVDGLDPLLDPPKTVMFAGCISSAQAGDLSAEVLMRRAEEALARASFDHPVVTAPAAMTDRVH